MSFLSNNFITQTRLLATSRADKQFLFHGFKNILAFDYIESGHTPILNKKFSIKDTVCDVLTLEEPAAELRHLDLAAKIAPDIPEHLIGDEYRLERILINLVSNAIKFTEKGYVKIIVSLVKYLDKKTCLLKIDIIDTGIGIPQE